MNKIISILLSLSLSLSLSYAISATEVNYIYNLGKYKVSNIKITEIICPEYFLKDQFSNTCIESNFSIINQTITGAGNFNHQNDLISINNIFDGDLDTLTNPWNAWTNGSNVTGTIFLDRPALNKNVTIYWRDTTSNGYGNRYALTISILDNGIWRNVYSNANLYAPNTGTNREVNINVTSMNAVRVFIRDIARGAPSLWIREIEIKDL